MSIYATEQRPFLTINHRERWEEGFLHDLAAGEQGITLQSAYRYRLQQTVPLDRIAPGFELADAAIGPCRLIYLTDSKAKSVVAYDAESGRAERLESVSSLLKQPGNVAYSPRGITVLDQAESTVIRFAEVNEQWIWHIRPDRDAAGRYPEGLHPLNITDMAAGPDGSLYALDAGQSRIVRVDAGGRMISVITVLEPLADGRAAIAISSEGCVYVLDTLERKVAVYSGLAKTQEFPVEGPISPSCIGIDKEGLVYVGDSESEGEDAAEDEKFIHIFRPDGGKAGVVSAFRGSSRKILFGHDDTMYVLSQAARTLSVLVREQALRKRDGAPLASGVYYAKALDSASFATPWQELSVDADIPESTQLEVAYLASDRKTFYLQDAERDLDSYLTDIAVPTDVKAEVLDGLPWSKPLLNPKDALLQGISGKYLWLRVRLIGSDRLTPTVRAISAVFPKNSYLRYLPGVYQEDDASRSFLERYLSLFEHFFAESEQAIGQMAKWFDTDAVTGEYLRWLAGWLAVAYDENWLEEKLRLLLRRISELYRKRGTRAGIESMIELFTGDKPYIVERFQLDAAEDVEVKQLLYKLFGSDPYGFCVVLKSPPADDSGYAAVKRIVEAEKPAHTTAGLVALQPWIVLDHHSYLEINSVLSKPNARLGEAVVGRDTVLDDRDAAGYVRGKSRVDLDTVLA
ncbi:MAG: phage tail protein [Bacillota bacterium]